MGFNVFTQAALSQLEQNYLGMRDPTAEGEKKKKQLDMVRKNMVQTVAFFSDQCATVFCAYTALFLSRQPISMLL